MKPGRELDQLVAEKIFGLEVVKETWDEGKECSYSIGEPDYWYTANEPGGYLHNPVPFYSTDIAAAWEVFEKVKLYRLERWNDGHGWSASSGRNRERGDTAPHAICLAALEENKK